MLGDYLYQLTPKDLNSLGIQLIHEQVQVSANQLQVQVTSSLVPADRMLILQHLFVRASSALVVLPLLLEAYVNLNGQSYRLISRSDSAAYAIYGEGLETHGMMIEPGASFSGNATFNALNVANTVEITILGYTIPRGTVGVG